MAVPVPAFDIIRIDPSNMPGISRCHLFFHQLIDFSHVDHSLFILVRFNNHNPKSVCFKSWFKTRVYEKIIKTINPKFALKDSFLRTC